MTFRIDAACACHKGNVRSNNEDNFLFDGIWLPLVNNGQTKPIHFSRTLRDDVCLAVFDGMGGGEFGEAASYAAASRLDSLCREIQHPEDIQAFLEHASDEMNLAVCQEAVDRQTGQMGSTEAILYLHGENIYACNIGDSRIYGLRGDRFLQISSDHSDEAYLREQNIVGRKPRLTQYLGMDPAQIRIEPSIRASILHPGDKYLLCSDGLTDMADTGLIRETMIVSQDAEDCVRKLIRMAVDNGGRDNVTAIAVFISEQRNSYQKAVSLLQDLFE